MDIVGVPSFVSHVELFWADPTIKAFIDRLASFSRIVIFDKLGTGLSDPVPGVPTLEERTAEIETVMDAVGLERAVLIGTSEGGSMSIAFAAMRPARVQALILAGVYPKFHGGGSPAAIKASYADAGIEERFWPTDEQIARGNALLDAVREHWGEGRALDLLLPSVIGQHAMMERFAASPGMAQATTESMARLDVTAILPAIQAPTLVMHAREDKMIPIQGARFVAERIPNARLFEFDGTDHLPWFAEHPDRAASEIEAFLTGASHVRQPDRTLATVLFTDIVASTERATELGDARWRAVLERHDEITRAELARFGGREVKATGDGFLATFDGPARAIRCAESIVNAVADLGIEVRAGVHTGECEIIGDDVGGLAVHIGARVASLASPGEVLVSRTVADLVVGSGIGFDDRGETELKGAPGKWQLYAVRAGGPAPDSAEAAITQTPTPGPRDSMRISDRIALAATRRLPGVMRGVTRAQQRLRRR